MSETARDLTALSDQDLRDLTALSDQDLKDLHTYLYMTTIFPSADKTREQQKLAELDRVTDEITRRAAQ